MDRKMLEYCLRHEDYWMKTLQTVYPHGLNEKTKFMNKYVPVDNFFSPMSRYGERFLNVRTEIILINESCLLIFQHFLITLNSFQ